MARQVLVRRGDSEEIDVDLAVDHRLDELEIGGPRGLVERNRRLLHELLELGQHLVIHLEVGGQFARLSTASRDASVALARELLRVGVEEIARRDRATKA